MQRMSRLNSWQNILHLPKTPKDCYLVGCSSAGLRMVQLLPVNDTSVDMTWRDSYPYSSVSVRSSCCTWRPASLFVPRLSLCASPLLQLVLAQAGVPCCCSDTSASFSDKMQRQPAQDPALVLLRLHMGRGAVRQVHALHPLYLSLDALVDDMPGDLQDRITEARSALDQPAVEYEGTMAAKTDIARALFDRRGASQLEVRTASSAGSPGWLQVVCFVFCGV